MGWASGIENGREIGYAVEAECDLPGCTTEIDRGLAYRCGGIPNFMDGKPGCGAYVCGEHNYFESCEVCEPSDSGSRERHADPSVNGSKDPQS